MSNPTLPADALLRLRQIIGRRNTDPPEPGLIPVSASTWWAGVKSGRYPKPVRLGPRVVAWRAKDILVLVDRGAS